MPNPYNTNYFKKHRGEATYAQIIASLGMTKAQIASVQATIDSLGLMEKFEKKGSASVKGGKSRSKKASGSSVRKTRRATAKEASRPAAKKTSRPAAKKISTSRGKRASTSGAKKARPARTSR
jgi:hypothetical protein